MTTRRRIAIWVGALFLGIVGAAAYGAARSGDDPGTVPLDAVLDVPGTFETPGIGTNAPVEGETLPDFTLTDLDGNTVSRADLMGTPTIINVWFSTCGPCKREMPVLVDAHAEFGDQVRIIGLNPVDTAESATAFAAEYGVDFPTLLDPDGEVTSDYGIATFPSTLFIAADGSIVRQKSGELTADDLRTTITEELLG